MNNFRLDLEDFSLDVAIRILVKKPSVNQIIYTLHRMYGL